jgi:quercetin dioxygenase-like cupin family protein
MRGTNIMPPPTYLCDAGSGYYTDGKGHMKRSWIFAADQIQTMASIDTTITNPRTGQTYHFLQTAASSNGALLEIESVFAPGSKEPPPHYHPAQSEEFTILKGELTVKLGKEIHVLRAGEALHLPAGTVHAMWNRSAEHTIVNWKTRPALNSEQLFETFTGLANDQRTNADGKPGLLQLAVTVPYFSNVFRVVKPPLAVQKVLFTALRPIGALLGYKPVYKKYFS